MMRVYEEMKVKRSMNDPSAKVYWARISALVDLRDGESLFAQGSSQKATGVQLNFWKNAKSLMSKFSTLRETSVEELAEQGLMFNPENNFWTTMFGRTFDVEENGKIMLDSKIIGTQLLKDSSMYMNQETERVLEEFNEDDPSSTSTSSKMLESEVN
jgi:hypothetical protein